MANRRRSAEKEAWWRSHVGRQAESGMSVRACCRENQLSEPSLYVWRRELRKRDLEGLQSGASGRPQSAEDAPRPVGECASSSGSTAGPTFVAVDVIPSAEQDAIQISLPGGAVVHVPADVSAETLERVLRPVSRPCEEGTSGSGPTTESVCGVSSC